MLGKVTLNYYSIMDLNKYDALNHTKLNCSTDTQAFSQLMKLSVSVSSVFSIVGAVLVILTVCMKPPSKLRTTNRNEAPMNRVVAPNYINGAHYGSTATVSSNSGAPRSDGNRQNNVNRAGSTSRRFCTNLRLVDRPAVFILISISVADILVAVSHLWGVLSSYEFTLTHHRNHTKYDYAECGAQALVSVFGTVSSLLWSDVLMFMAVVMFWCKKENIERLISVYAFVVYNFIGWVVPFLVVMILGAGVDAFGFAQGIGWCYMNLNNGRAKEDLLIAWLSYDIWANLSILFITCAALFFIAIVIANFFKERNRAENIVESVRLIDDQDDTMQSDRRTNRQLSCKMVSAALFVVLLRVWSFIINIYLFEPEHSSERNKYLCNSVLQILSGIGTSSQGIVNAILFVFTPCFVRLCKLCTRHRRQQN